MKVGVQDIGLPRSFQLQSVSMVTAHATPLSALFSMKRLGQLLRSLWKRRKDKSRAVILTGRKKIHRLQQITCIQDLDCKSSRSVHSPSDGFSQNSIRKAYEIKFPKFDLRLKTKCGWTNSECFLHIISFIIKHSAS